MALVDYVLADDGSGTTLAQLTLRLSDPDSPLRGREFKVTCCSCCPRWAHTMQAAWVAELGATLTARCRAAMVASSTGCRVGAAVTGLQHQTRFIIDWPSH